MRANRWYAAPFSRFRRHRASASASGWFRASDTIHAASRTESAATSRAHGLPIRTSNASRTSFAFPTAKPSGSSIAVTSAAARRPAPFAPFTRACASATASSRVFMNAPAPHLTSKTSVRAPSASFLERIEATMSGIEGTVPVTSRRA